MTVHRDWWLRRTCSQQTDGAGKRGGSRRRDLWGPTAVRQAPREGRRAVFAYVQRQCLCVSNVMCVLCRCVRDRRQCGKTWMMLSTRVEYTAPFDDPKTQCWTDAIKLHG